MCISLGCFYIVSFLQYSFSNTVLTPRNQQQTRNPKASRNFLCRSSTVRPRHLSVSFHFRVRLPFRCVSGQADNSNRAQSDWYADGNRRKRNLETRNRLERISPPCPVAALTLVLANLYVFANNSPPSSLTDSLPIARDLFLRGIVFLSLSSVPRNVY